MSLQRCVAPATSSFSTILRFAPSATSKNPRACVHASRSFTSSRRTGLSSKRELQTATAYRPQNLDFVPAPPRNTGIPDSSIAGDVPQINDTRPPLSPALRKPPSIIEQFTVSVPEGEAQKSKPKPPADSSREPSQASTRPKRSRLRPRKAAMSLTPTAISHLRDLLQLPEPKLIRVGVKNRGCSGLAYHLEYVEKPGAFDETVEQDGVKVLIDSKALFSIIGSEMDWVEDKLNQRFVFRNPNISEYSKAQRKTAD
ncbi:Iron-sulfur assembly protein 1 [Lignoscripta atroalba]|nr:Iron-sulfur assembly protein 1 [Lignoscripta atroalba]